MVSYADLSLMQICQPPSQKLETPKATDQEEAEVLQYFGAVDEPPVVTESAPELSAKTVHIREGDSGYSYQNLFGPYLKGAKKVYVVDPYIRLEHQIRNFMVFAGILDTSAGPVELRLTTSAEDAYQEKMLEQKLKEIAASLSQHGISFAFEVDPAIHDRSIRADNGWCIYPGRGLDFFPETRIEIRIKRDRSNKEKMP